MYIHTLLLQIERGFVLLDMGQTKSKISSVSSDKAPRLDSFGYAKHPKNTLEISDFCRSFLTADESRNELMDVGKFVCHKYWLPLNTHVPDPWDERYIYNTFTIQ